MFSNGAMILMMFAALTLVPLGIVFLVLHTVKRRRAKKVRTYQGRTEGEVIQFVRRMDHPSVIHLRYTVAGETYTLKESAKMKRSAWKVKGIPVGQRITPVLGEIKVGGTLPVQYAVENPKKAIIMGNDGVITSQ